MPNIRSYLRERKNRTLDSFEDKIFRHRRSTFLTVLGIVLFLVLLFVFLILQWRNHIYTYYDTMSSVEREVINGTEDIPLGEAILTYSRDGAHCTDTRGNVLWNQTYEIQDVIIDVCQNVAVIASYSGRDVYVVSDSAILGNFSTNMPIRNAAVAANGRVAVVMESAEASYYNIYSPEGEQIYEGLATMSSSGDPMALSLSPSGDLLQISYIYLDAGVQKTNIAFYNLGEVGASKTDFFVGAYNYDDLFVPFVCFMNNSVSFAVGDSQLMFYRGTQIPEEIQKYPYTEEIRSVFYSDQYVGLVFYADNGDSLYRMDVYDSSGGLVGTYDFNVEYTDLFFGEDCFVVYNDAECVVTALSSGVEKFNGPLEKSVRRILPMKTSYRYLLITGESLDTIRLR